jgi:thiosulfate/3-mercaptopyruvate sulfurtransferase
MSQSGFFRGSHKRQDLVSTKRLLERLERPDIAVVDASVSKIDDIWLSDRAAFESGHITGARFADLVSDFSDPEGPFAFTRPTAARLASAARAIGLTNRQQIVIYDNTTDIWAARLWWLFKAFGHDEVSVLDGGLTAWRLLSRRILPQLSGPAFSLTKMKCLRLSRAERGASRLRSSP